MADGSAPKRMVGIFLFELETGKMPNLEVLAKQVADLLAGVSCGWHVIYYPPNDAPPVAKPRWRVKVDAVNVRTGPGVTFSIIIQARRGDVFTQKNISQGWVEMEEGGWINQSLLEAV